MSTSKLRGKSAIHINESVISTNSNNSQNTLLKIESVVPKLTNRINNTTNLNHSSRLKTFHRSHSTLSSSYLKKVNEKRLFINREAVGERAGESLRDQPHCIHNEPQPDGSVLVHNGITTIKRSEKDREKHPDRVNLDRKGLGSIPIIDDEPNLRLLSLQHNLINTFHIPAETDSNNNESKQSAHGHSPSVSVTPNSANQSPTASTNSPNAVSNTTIKDGSTTTSHTISAAANHSPYATSRSAKQFLRQKSTSRNQLYMNSNNINYLASKVTLTAKPLNGLTNASSGQSPTSATSPNSTFLQKPSSILLSAKHRHLLKKSNSFISNATLFPSPPAHQQQITANNVMKLKNKLLRTPSFSIDNLCSKSEANLFNEITNSNNNSGKTTPTNPLTNTINHFVNPQNHISPILSAAEPRYNLQNLVFLDLYDNQIEKISCLDGLKCLTVLLLGKNRITDLAGLVSLRQTLRVLDLHGNKISNITSKVNQLQELKSLNLAGNQLRQIYAQDFNGLVNLKELNLKRNRIKKIHGFDDLRSLERLWLCHNDLQCVEDMSAIAKAINLKEVTIENNPVSLAGDCVSFLVSYLPGLVSLSQMQITEQVRRAASAWRKNKELSDLNYTNLSTDVCLSIRREEIISNARTNWELLRSQQTIACRNVQRTTGTNHASVGKDGKVDSSSTPSDVPKTKGKTKKTSTNMNGTNSTNHHRPARPVKKPQNRKLIRSSSQDNSGSQISEQGGEDYFRLPPILAPFLDQNPITAASASKIESSESSTCQQLDSSVSSIFSSDNEDLNVKDFENDAEKEGSLIDRMATPVKLPDTPPLQNPVEEDLKNDDDSSDPVEHDHPANVNNPDEANHDKQSTLSTVSLKTTSDSNATTSSNSDDRLIITQKMRTSVPVKRYGIGTLVRTNTARSSTMNTTSSLANTSNLANPTIPNPISSNVGPSVSGNAVTSSGYVTPAKSKVTEREREQGGDYLIEICGRYLNVYGMGALRFIDKQWNMSKASDVHTVKFSYINFNNITAVLCRIKIRFVNAENFIFRETNITCLGQINALAESQGIASLTIDPEGNPIANKNWHSYAIYRLSHWGLKQINGIEITEEEVRSAENMYSGLSDLVLWSLPEGLLQPLLQRLRLDETAHATKMTAKEWLMQADSSLKNVVGKEALQWKKHHSSSQDDATMRTKGKAYFARMLDNTCNAVEKLQQLENMWPSLMMEMIRNTLIDYSQIDVYVRSMLQDLSK
ncbi:GATA zinc finger domain-containing protein 7 [Topomyia yanbarensis]|uniref:GATA zinc finger domain-containing protein 7 n=1 Tax=Topomyia yanbarensis TaxID=2498891 RepID=UPI00273AF89C|nr:GATA zinc finger domain-containing protein 7 [Topomyia yanbarensis]